jgi:hypothetical protein
LRRDRLERQASEIDRQTHPQFPDRRGRRIQRFVRLFEAAQQRRDALVIGACPSPVRTKARVERRNNLTPSRCSSLAMLFETGDTARNIIRWIDETGRSAQG